MKRLKLLSSLFVLLLVVIPSLALKAEAPGSIGVQSDDREKAEMVVKIIYLAKVDSKAGKFEEALNLLDTAIEVITQKEYREKLQIEVADVHLWWAVNLKRKYDFPGAIKHFEIAYAIDKNYRPKVAAIALNNIGFLYDTLGQTQKALEYHEKAISR